MTEFFDYWSTTLFFATFRVTLCFTVAYLLLRSMQIRSARLHRIAWAAVVCQGCMLGSWTIAISVPYAQTDFPNSSVEYVESEVSLEDTNQASLIPRQTIHEPEVKKSIWDISRQLFVSLWAIGIVFTASRHVWRYATFVATVSLGEKPSSEWSLEWEDVLHEFPTFWSVQLRVTEGTGPAVCFVPWGYLVFVPKSIWQKLTPRERLSVLRHELSHIQRMDLWKAAVIRVAALLQWFNPLVWNAVRRFDEASEWACDDQVQALSTSEYDYAKTLLTVGEYVTHPPSFMPSMSGGNLSKRIRRIVSEIKEDSIVKKCVLTLGLVLVSLTAVRVHPVYADESKPKSGSNRDYNVVPPDATISLPVKSVLKVTVARHSIDLDVGSRRFIRFDVPVKAIRSRDVGIANAIHTDDMGIELSALKSGTTEVEVQTEKNGTIVLSVNAVKPREGQQIELKMQLLKINADKLTIKRMLGQLFPAQVAEADSRMYLTVRDEKGLKEKLNAIQAKLIDDPTLVTVSGRLSRFVTGGEIPIEIPQALGKAAVEWRKFGTRVDLVPVIMSNQRLRLEIRPSVITLKFDTVGNTRIPTTVTRYVDTATEMDFNKVVIVAMVDEDTENEGSQNCFITTVQPRLMKMESH